MKRQYHITIMRPGGNDQLLIQGLVKKESKVRINNEMIRLFPRIEQVSFYTYDAKQNLARLELAGGEFCGNATRSLAYFLLEGQPGEITIQVSGTKHLLRAGIKEQNTAFSQMPIFPSLDSVQQLSSTLWKVSLEGIVHLVSTKYPETASENVLKEYAREILRKEDLLLSSPAAGVMFVDQQEELVEMKPVVWVRDIDTLLYETACASGTSAVGLWLSLQKNLLSLTQEIKQPTGKNILVSVERTSREFVSAYIDGPIEILKRGTIELETV